VAQQAGDHVAVAHAAAGADVAGLVEQAGAEDALERAHQPAFVALDVRGDGGAAVVPLGLELGARRVGAEEHRARHRGLAVLQRHQAHTGATRLRQRYRRVGGAEVDGGPTGH
jgi:hypothetical protein